MEKKNREPYLAGTTCVIVGTKREVIVVRELGQKGLYKDGAQIKDYTYEVKHRLAGGDDDKNSYSGHEIEPKTRLVC